MDLANSIDSPPFLMGTGAHDEPMTLNSFVDKLDKNLAPPSQGKNFVFSLVFSLVFSFDAAVHLLQVFS